MIMLSTGCASSRPSTLPIGAAAYDTIPDRVSSVEEDLIRVGDRLAIKVLGEEDLTSDQYLVDEAGNVDFPMVGDVAAVGRTASAVRAEITRKLGARYIRDPRVAVSMAERKKQNFTVEGQVRDPGRFEITPDMTLLGALAMAHSPTQKAKLNEVIVLRDVKGQHLGARFNLNEIRSGHAPDPQIIAGDKVVVGLSGLKGAWFDILQAAPLFNIFYAIK
jgi:polysaccharide export outer membrane protein